MHKWKKYSKLTISFMILLLSISPVVAQRQTETVNEYYDYSDSNGFLCTVRVSLNGFPTIENRKEIYTARLTVQNFDTSSSVEIRLKRISWEVRTDEGVETGEEEVNSSLNAVGNSYDFEFNVKSISDEYSGDATLTAEFRHDIYRDGIKIRPDEKSSISTNLKVFAVEESPSPTTPPDGNTSSESNTSFGAITRYLPVFIVIILIFVVIGSIARKRKPRYEGTTVPVIATQIESMTYDELLGRREVLDDGLRRIETQLNAGLLTPQQYMDTYTKYRSEWIQINRRLSVAGISEQESEIESEMIPSPMEELACPSCGTPYPSDTPFCPTCGVEREKCTVCLLPMEPGSEITKCPHCSGIAHKDHLQEWVKIKGFCPKCKNKLTEYDLIQ
ncbi:MAG: hypothetical protein KAI34_00985 [Candidatus Lokiarchaeota archaeon]|nr:hypothetical protein [Candidatus Lokiarchaeota archaeon]